MSHELSRRSNIPSGMAWMIGLSAALFWLPVVGPFIAGFVGGKKAGGLKPAVAAVFLPGFGLWLFAVVFGTLLGSIPILGQIVALITGLGAFALSFVHIIPLFIGAVVGGMSERKGNLDSRF